MTRPSHSVDRARTRLALTTKRLVLAGLAALAASCSGTANVKLAEQRIGEFHSNFNAGRFAQIYDLSAEDMKAATKRQDFVAFLEGAKKKLGSFQQGKQTGWNENFTTGGHFVTVAFESKFENGPVQEQFVYRMNDDRAVLAGYHANSNLFVTQ